MDSSRTEAPPMPSTREASAGPIRLPLDGDVKKHFDAFENLFFQQGDEDSVPGANDTYDDGEPSIKRWLPYRTLMGISIASTTVAVIACIALWRNSAPASTDLTALPPTHVTPPAPMGVAVAPAAPTPAVPAPAAQDPAPAAQDPAPAAQDPTPAAQDPALAAQDPAAAAPAKGLAPTAPVAEPTPTEPAATPPAAPAPAPAVAVQAAEPAAAPAAEPAAPVVARAEPAKPEPDKTQEAPVAQAAPAENEARDRCRQAIRARKGKDIVSLCSAAFEQDATDADAAIAVAKVEFDRGRFAQAHNWSKKAIAVNPAAAEAYVYAGGAEQNQGHGKAAKEAYLQYLRLAPSGRYAAELRTIVNSL